MGRFEYEGREWFNVGSGCLLLAFICLVQLLWTFVGYQQEHWTYSMIYFAGFLLIGGSLLTKRAFLALMGVVSCAFFVVVDIPLVIEGFIIEPVYLSILAVVSLIMIVIGALDFFGFITVKENLEGANYFIISGFTILLVWNIIHSYLLLNSTDATLTSWALNILLYPFLLLSILALIREIANISIDKEVINNISFLSAVLEFIVILVSWQSGILLSIFG